MADSKQTVVTFLTGSSDSLLDDFVNGIAEELPEHICKYERLSNDVSEPFLKQRSEEHDAVVLLHSVQEGRNAVTDVPDAKYDELLPQLKRKYGAGRVAVIVYSMSSLQQSYNKDAMRLAFIRNQPTTFDCSECVIQCNNLLTMDTASHNKLISFLREKIEEKKDPEYYDNRVAVLSHYGTDTFKLSRDLKRQRPYTTFDSMDEESMESIRHYKAVLVLVDKKDFENRWMFADLTTGYSSKIEPKGHLGLLLKEEKDEPVSIREFNKLTRIKLFVYRREQDMYIFEETTLHAMKKWFIKDCCLQANASCLNSMKN